MAQDGFSAFTRREFLWNGLTMASAAATVPWFLNSSASAMNNALLAAGTSSLPGVPDDHILVVVQLSGGNDGLNTVVPFGAPEYYRLRPGIAIPQNQVLTLSGSEGIGLHPGMTGFKELYDEGMMALVQGVGYPNPNRSHFKSMDIWHTADTTATGDGWLGRYFDSECCGFGKGESGRVDKAPAKGEGTKPATGGPPGIAIGRSAPLAMQGRQIKPVSFESADLFRWSGEDIHEALRDPYHALQRRGGDAGGEEETNAAFLLRTSLDAQVSSDLIRKAVAIRPQVQFPGNQVGQQLAMVSSMIRAGLKTRVYYVQHGGFDTHAGQGGAQGRHSNLLGQLAQAVSAFYRDLKAHGNADRVLTMSFSEFGRRVGQNASQGTDHGTAAPMFLFGSMVKAGVHGDHPSLKDLDQGDLKYLIDFREVYAGILDGWLKADAKTILEGSYRPLSVIKPA
ncbi:MAG: DUF1501 domain-containing protein [Planctomycetota bacterium]|nr:DUF1501 domain-containing protein [Planctomycetota bacterium]